MPPDRTQAKNPLWLRAAYFATGVVLLFWLTVEDATLQTPLVMSAWVTGLLGLQTWIRFGATPCSRIWRRYPSAGIFLGALIAPLAVFMTIFKSGLHAHGFLEFTAAELAPVLRLTPALGLGGLAMGFVGGLLRRRACEGMS